MWERNINTERERERDRERDRDREARVRERERGYRCGRDWSVWKREDAGVGERDRSEKKGERQGWEIEKDKKRFRVGERKTGQDTGVVQR